MENYAIKLNIDSFILGIEKFKTGETIPGDWIQISKAQYDSIAPIWKPWHQYISGALVDNPVEQAKYEGGVQIADLRATIKFIMSEIELNTELGEPTTALESLLTTKKAEYDALVNP